MNTFETTLLREKFTITNNGSKVIAPSNRIVCPLYNRHGDLIEQFTVRGHNMHSCTRMVSQLVQNFYAGGSLLNRGTPLNWSRLWQSSISEYERSYNPDLWGAVYHQDKVIFESGARHPFFDMIEKCMMKSPNASYEGALNLAKDIFKQSGKNFDIDYDTNVALIITAEDNAVKCRTILRGAEKTTTFNFSVALSPSEYKSATPAPFVAISASYIEAIQLCFVIGVLTKEKQLGLADRNTPKAIQLAEATNRLSTLQAEISNFETLYKISYRPEKPNFNRMIASAKAHAKIAPPNEKWV